MKTKFITLNHPTLASVVFTGIIGVGCLGWPLVSTSAPLDDMLKEQRATNKNSIDSQKRIDRLNEQIQAKVDEFKEIERERRVLKSYNDKIARLVNQQQQEITSLNEQIDGIEQTSREVTPLMLDMIDGLDEFIGLDYPFLLKERKNRIGELRRIMDLASIADSEKYRLILEAYQIENDYGASIESYSETIKVSETSSPLTVSVLRFGRVALVYQTLDQSQSGYWNNDTRLWEPLPTSFNQAVRKGLLIAQKQESPDLINLPLPAPEVIVQ